MDAILRFFTSNEVWVYILLGVIGLVYLRKLAGAIQEGRGVIFGLERNNTQRRLNEAVSILVLLGMLGLGEFVLVSFVAPSLPGVQILPTPTIQILGTPGTQQDAQGTQPRTTVEGTPISTLAVQASSCIPGQLEFTQPVQGGVVSGKVTLKGTIRVQNFGFYKYEFASLSSQTWTTIQAGDYIRCEQADCINPAATEMPPDVLGDWDTSLLMPGDYFLRLVVTDNQGQVLPACQIQIRISPPE